MNMDNYTMCCFLKNLKYRDGAKKSDLFDEGEI